MLSTIYSTIALSQDSNIISHSSKETIDNYQPNSYIDYDSIWCFHPFSINIYSGLWTPVGTLNDYFNPSAKLGASFGLMISKNMKIELGLNAIIHNNKDELELFADETSKNTNKTTGASLGGWLTYSVYKDRIIYLDILSGLTWETIDTDIENLNDDPEDEYDDNLSVSTFGVSIGSDLWLNIIGTHNIGIRLLYSYAPYNNDDILKTKIGGHSISTSLIYRFPKRNQIFRKYY